MRKHKTIRLFVNSLLSKKQRISLSKEQSKYLISVMRLKQNDEIFVFDGKSGEYSANIIRADRNATDIIVTNKVKEHKNSPDLTLFFCPVKNAKPEFIVQKATELGVSKICPIITENTVKTGVNIERLRIIAIEAAEQCERLDVPQISEIQKLKDILNSLNNYNLFFCDETGQGKAFSESSLQMSPRLHEGVRCRGEHGMTFARENSGNDNTEIPPLPAREDKGGGAGEFGTPPSSSPRKQRKKTLVNSLPPAILIGPEGGFTDSEIKQIYSFENSFGVGLGPRILRADTAIITAISLWQSYFGDFTELPDFRG